MKTSLSYFLVLDIETSQKTEKVIEDGEEKERPVAVWLSYGCIKLYDNKANTIEKLLFREWSELFTFLSSVNITFTNKKIICFVHNLSYEFDFLIKNLSLYSKILANSTHKVISSNLEYFGNIEFRCTYMLTGLSLRKMGELIGYPKLESDYRTVTPIDDILPEEWGYNERDCDVVAEYLVKVYFKEYNLSTIPYTKTGIVRKKFKEFYKISNTPHNWDLMPPENCYQALNDAFQGAITISNPVFTGYEVYNLKSYDEASEYPSIMLKERFPYNIKKLDEFSQNENEKHEFYIMRVKFYNIRSKYEWAWLSRSKFHDYDMLSSVFYNGKLISSEYVERTITNIDFDNIKNTYDFDEYEIVEFYQLYNIDYLPEEYIETIKFFAEPKYEYKKLLNSTNENAPEFPEIAKSYMLAKNDFNSIYGMCVQKICPTEYIIDDFFQWHENDLKYECNPKTHMKRNFLIGIFITAYARRNWLNAVIKNCPYTFVYGDTDSIKFIGDTFIETNSRLQPEYDSIPYLHGLGLFDEEEPYDKFVTWGAKKYAYEREGIVHTVVAGLPKAKLNTLNEFVPGKIFRNCKNAKVYIYNNQYYINDSDEFIEKPDIEKISNESLQYLKEHNINTNGGVGLYPVNYKLDITNEDKFYLNSIRKDIKKWLKEYSQLSGINLMNYVNLEQAQTLFTVNGVTEKHMQ